MSNPRSLFQLIGERLNPSGKPYLARAIARRDPTPLWEEAHRQVTAGAVALDVNAYLPNGDDEGAALLWALRAVREVVDLPLCPDSADPAALMAALDACSGPLLINSVSGRRGVPAALLPAVAAHKAAVILQPRDEAGAPPDAPGRLRLASRLVEQAVRVGIPRQAILVDALAYPHSAGPVARATTLRTITLLDAELGVGTVVGVGNVGYGSPERAAVVVAFLRDAIAAGLSAAICDPLLPGVLGSDPPDITPLPHQPVPQHHGKVCHVAVHIVAPAAA